VPYTIVLHIQNTDPVVGEVEEIPTPVDNLVIIRNPRRLDGKDLHFLNENVVTVIWPIERMHFIEVLSDEEQEEIIGFVRE
jgi:predicted nucleotidyltransferase